jgi:hypothetical protein
MVLLGKGYEEFIKYGAYLFGQLANSSMHKKSMR